MRHAPPSRPATPVILFVLALVALVARADGPAAATRPAGATAAQGAKPMQTFVILFRQGPFDLTPEQLAKRADETRPWAARQQAAGLTLDPRLLGRQPAHAAGPNRPGAPPADASWPVTATLFVEAPDFEAAARAADEHPARRYGASVEVRPWSGPPAPPPAADAATFPARQVGVSIARPAGDVYAFAADPANLPRWARGLAGAIRRAGDAWVADSPMGVVKVRFAAANALGVLDHDVTLPSGEVVHNPMRVVPNGRGCELTFTLFRRPGASVQEFRADAATVEGDLRTLKGLLER
jgi:hypothetical protein